MLFLGEFDFDSFKKKHFKDFKCFDVNWNFRYFEEIRKFN